VRDRSVLLRWAALAFLASLLLVPLIARSTRGGASTAPQSPTTFTDGQPALFYDQAAFLKAVRDADTVPAPEGAVIGGIVPHHLLPGYLINGFFRGLAATSHPKTIVLIGPNHRNEGRARVLTSELPWQTPFGTIEPDRELIDALTASGLASVDNSVLPSEHSVAGIMPAIKYYLPDARVVPLILNGATSLEETRRLGDALAANWNADTVFVAPEDFSHYLIASEAERYDAVTLQALRDRDSAILFTLNNQYLDSPPSIATLMAAVDALGAKDFVLQAHTNSGALLHDDLAPTTSYFVGYYRMASSRTEPAAR
jgi:AmmeMemoRadiSam system protein B